MNTESRKFLMINPGIMADVDLFLEDIYPESKKAGDEMVKAKLGNSQIRGFERIVVSTRRFSEIINYIKNQTGKEREKKWLAVSPLLLGQLELIENKAKEISNGEPAVTLDIKLRLARGWAKQIVSHFLFKSLEKEEGVSID